MAYLLEGPPSHMGDVVLKKYQVSFVRVLPSNRASVHRATMLKKYIWTDFCLGHTMRNHYLLKLVLRACFVVTMGHIHQL